ncbi:MAG: hypothetical protein P1Q69_02640 [Candidatus Thorarchaeota archaeon]|nr:hypothetical protein [Candidatus Thorarchaeota archaeon]
MTDDRSLDELPDQVFVALGRRGMEGILLKECAYCDGIELSLTDVNTDPPEIAGKGVEEVIADWNVKCDKCNRAFTIRCKVRYHDNEKMDTMVNIIEDTGKDLGWLGSY